MAGRGKGERNAIQREQDGENLLGQGSDVPKLPARSVGPASAIQGAPRFLSFLFPLLFSNVGIIQVDKQALTCISYEVVEDRDSFSRIRTRYNYHVNRPSDTFVFTRYSSGQE